MYLYVCGALALEEDFTGALYADRRLTTSDDYRSSLWGTAIFGFS